MIYQFSQHHLPFYFYIRDITKKMCTLVYQTDASIPYLNVLPYIRKIDIIGK